MSYKELHPEEFENDILEIAKHLNIDKNYVESLIEKALEEAFELGYDDGIELMRDPAWSREHI